MPFLAIYPAPIFCRRRHREGYRSRRSGPEVRHRRRLSAHDYGSYKEKPRLRRTEASREVTLMLFRSLSKAQIHINGCPKNAGRCPKKTFAQAARAGACDVKNTEGTDLLSKNCSLNRDVE